MYRLDIRFKWWAFLFSTGMLILLGSCRSDTAYHVYQSWRASGWGRQDTLVYELPASLSPGRYLVEIGLRNTSEYAYRDIWLALLSGQGVIPEDAVSSGRGSNLQADSCAFRQIPCIFIWPTNTDGGCTTAFPEACIKVNGRLLLFVWLILYLTSPVPYGWCI